MADDTEAMRAEVALLKGLTPAQVKRLVGATREELEADADELLTLFPRTSDGVAQGVGTLPDRIGDLHGGGDPTQPHSDLRKIINDIPR
jgi:hypothetical protein